MLNKNEQARNVFDALIGYCGMITDPNNSELMNTRKDIDDMYTLDKETGKINQFTGSFQDKYYNLLIQQLTYYREQHFQYPPLEGNIFVNYIEKQIESEINGKLKSLGEKPENSHEYGLWLTDREYIVEEAVQIKDTLSGRLKTELI